MKTPQNFIYPEIKETDYHFGGILSDPQDILRPDGDWRRYTPPGETQRRNGVESSSCFIEASQHAIATILEEQFDLADQNFSARFNLIYAGASTDGGDPLKGAQTFRDKGLIPDSMLPFSDDIKSWEEFNSYKGGDKEKCEGEGKRWRQQWDPRYDIVVTRDMDVEAKYKLLKQALKYSPLPVSVASGYEIGLPKSKDQRDIHLVELIHIDSDNRPVVWDTYPPYQKTLPPMYNFDFGMRWTIKHIEMEQITLMEKILNLLKKLVPFLQAHPDAKPTDEVPELNEQPMDQTPAPIVDPLPVKPQYVWDTPTLARHSARQIMDEYNLSWTEKDLLCAVLQAESGLSPKAVNVNKNGSTDWGIAQINNTWWIGEGRYFKTVEEVVNHPEKSVRFMVERYKEGKLDLWWAYKNGSYKKYL